VFAAALESAAILAQPAAFDVASVKPTAIANGLVEFQMRPGGRLAVFGMSLRDLVRRAYGSDEIQRTEQVIGGPEWAGSDRYDVLAVTDPAIDADPEHKTMRMLAMLRTLLEDRFKLKVHTEMREADIFNLVLANRDGKLGANLHRSTIDCPTRVPGAAPNRDPIRWCGVRGGGFNGVLAGQGVSMKEIVAVLAIFPTVARPVRDRTGLEGKFDFRAEFTPALVPGATADSPALPNPAADTGPSLFTAFQEQLGLKLQNERARILFLVIDSADHPTEN
jgi:uncharacterized protein (TIGR03435 family)